MLHYGFVVISSGFGWISCMWIGIHIFIIYKAFPENKYYHLPESKVRFRAGSVAHTSRRTHSNVNEIGGKACGLNSLHGLISPNQALRIQCVLWDVWRISFRSAFRITEL